MKRSSPRQSRYAPAGEGKFAIEIHLGRASQLFDQKDPSPFRDRDLDDDAADYLLSSAQEVGQERLGQIRIHIADADLSPFSESEIIDGVRRYFLYEAERLRKKIGETLRKGVKSLFFGLTFLTLAVAVQLSLKGDELSFLQSFVKEGVFLLGWVSMWTPVNTFLYEWWPIADLRRLELHIAEMDILVINTPLPGNHP